MKINAAKRGLLHLLSFLSYSITSELFLGKTSLVLTPLKNELFLTFLCIAEIVPTIYEVAQTYHIFH